jgi:hypothetical protein
VHSMSRRREADFKEKEPIPPLFHFNPPHRSAVTSAPFDGCLHGAASAQMRDRCPDRESAWSSAEVSTRLPYPVCSVLRRHTPPMSASQTPYILRIPPFTLSTSSSHHHLLWPPFLLFSLNVRV